MTSYLIVSKSEEKKEEEYQKLFTQFSIDPIDITRIKKPEEGKEKGRKTTKSIGIEDVKIARQNLFLKPVKGQMKAIVYEDGQLLTHEAQNALLKVIEEPPKHTIFIIGTTNKDSLLPTIQSRCAIIELADNQAEESELSEAFAEAFDHMQVADALFLAQQYDKAKDGMAKELERTILLLHTRMLESDNEKAFFANGVKTLQRAHTTITTTNANKRLSLEAALLSIASD